MDQIRIKTKSLFSKKYCGNEDCQTVFLPKTYNGIYCSADCRKISTNRKLLEKYHSNKKNKNLKRMCVTSSCTTILSTYNKEKICEPCKVNRYIARLVSWGWDEQKLRDEF